MEKNLCWLLIFLRLFFLLYAFRRHWLASVWDILSLNSGPQGAEVWLWASHKWQTKSWAIGHQRARATVGGQATHSHCGWSGHMYTHNIKDSLSLLKISSTWRNDVSRRCSWWLWFIMNEKSQVQSHYFLFFIFEQRKKSNPMDKRHAFFCILFLLS